MRRREFIAGLSGAAAWPLAAQGQQTERVRRIGLLMLGDENDPVRGTKGWLSTFTRGLAELGWTGGRNLRMDVRWDGDNVDRQRMYAKELADLQPDVIVVATTPQTAAFQQQTRTIPIVFVMVSDPIGSGFAASLPAQAGISPASCSKKREWRANGWSCSRRSRCQAGSIDVQSRHGTLC
jgi:putative ABC transport system substrate-binding protein